MPSDGEPGFLWLYDDRVGLSPAERSAWVKVHVHGLGIEELAARTDRDPAAVNALLADAAEKRRESPVRDRWRTQDGEQREARV